MAIAAISRSMSPVAAAPPLQELMRLHILRLLICAAVAATCTSTRAADAASTDIIRFDITRFDVEGNTLLPASTVERTVAPFAGKSRDFGDVQRALEALEGEYRKLGYNVVQVALPEQELNQGVIKLQVIETKLGAVKVEGNTAHDETNIRRSLPGLRPGETPNLGRVSASLKLANENPSKKTALQLQSGDKDDEVDAVLKITEERVWKVSAAFDNTGNASTGDTHVTLQAQHANIGNLDHVLSLQYTTTLEKPSQVSVYGAGYHIPLYSLGDSIDLYANYSDVDSGSVTAGIFSLQVSGRGSVFGGRYNQNLKRIGEYEHKLSYGIDYKAFQNNVLLSGAQLGNDVTVHPLSVAYSGTLGLAEGQVDVGVTALHNLPGGSRGSAADFNRVRAGAPAGYNILRYNAGYSRALPGDWQMRFALSGQYTRDALVPGEQFGAGGASSVRGFGERDLSNDYGYLVNAEVYTPNICKGIEKISTQCRVLAFYDTANVTRIDPLPGELAQGSIGSVGLGLRVSVDKYLSLQLDVGQVVDAGVTQAKGDRKLHFRLALNY
jgi:hemolysin activation/secretion protein